MHAEGSSDQMFLFPGIRLVGFLSDRSNRTSEKVTDPMLRRMQRGTRTFRKW